MLPDVFLSSPVVLAGDVDVLGWAVVLDAPVLALPAAPMVSVASFAASVAPVSAMPVSASVSALPIVEVGADVVGSVPCVVAVVFAAELASVVEAVLASVVAAVSAFAVPFAVGVLVVSGEVCAVGAERLQPTRLAPIRNAPAMEEVMNVLESMEFSVWFRWPATGRLRGRSSAVAQCPDGRVLDEPLPVDEVVEPEGVVLACVDVVLDPPPLPSELPLLALPWLALLLASLCCVS